MNFLYFKQLPLTACVVIGCVWIVSFCGIAGADHDGERPPNVAILLFDALRPDHLGCYSYDRETSPFIDTLAAEGIRFERAYAPSSFTRESVATLFTGLLPSRGGHTGWGAAPQSDKPVLAELFRNAGYATALLSDAIMIDAQPFRRGFEHVEFVSEFWAVSGAGPEVSRGALVQARAASESARPFFLYCHYMDPHAPYEPPDDFRSRIDVAAPERPAFLYSHVRPNVPALVSEGFGPGELRFDDLVARYDAEIRHIDHAVRLFFEGLKEMGALNNTVVIITADHGEEFLEHGYVDHGWTLYEESIRVPLIVWNPKRLKPAVVKGPVSLVDVMPTLARWLELEGPSESDGIPWIESGHEQITEPPREAPVISELRIRYRNILSAVIGPRWKYISVQKWVSVPLRKRLIENQEAIMKAYRNGKREAPGLHSAPVREVWFDLEADPGEQGEATGDMPEAVVRLKEALKRYKGRCDVDGKQKDVAPPDSEEEREALKSLGYL